MTAGDRVGGCRFMVFRLQLEKFVVEREKLLRDAGITFTMNTNIGRDISFVELRENMMLC